MAQEINRDDFLYAILLLLGIGFGQFYRKITDLSARLFTGTAFGIGIILFTSGFYSAYIFASFLVSCVIIKLFRM